MRQPVLALHMGFVRPFPTSRTFYCTPQLFDAADPAYLHYVDAPVGQVLWQVRVNHHVVLIVSVPVADTGTACQTAGMTPQAP